VLVALQHVGLLVRHWHQQFEHEMLADPVHVVGQLAQPRRLPAVHRLVTFGIVAHQHLDEGRFEIGDVLGVAVAAFGIFIPQLVFVPLLQAAVNRRTGARIQVLRRLGIAIIAGAGGVDDESGRTDDRRIEQAFALDMGIFKLKFSMNFLMNVCNHLQIISALLVGGWWVCTSRLEIGGVVAFISGIGRLNDPWGDLVNYFRDINVTQIKYRLLAEAVDRLL
jgi:hypothetical protein